MSDQEDMNRTKATWTTSERLESLKLMREIETGLMKKPDDSADASIQGIHEGFALAFEDLESQTYSDSFRKPDGLG